MKETVTEGSRFPVNYQDPEGEGGRKIVKTEEIDNNVEFHQKSIIKQRCRMALWLDRNFVPLDRNTQPGQGTAIETF